jgi:hypothetical protein
LNDLVILERSFLMGYATNTQMSAMTPLEAIKATVGTWAVAVSANIWTLDHTNAADTSVLHIPVRIPGNAAYNAGGILTSLDFFWNNASLDIVDILPTVYTVNYPAQAGTITVTSQTFTYDSGHDTTAKRKTQAQHKMTITLTPGVQIRGDQELIISLSVQTGATSVFKLQGVKANYTLRV